MKSLLGRIKVLLLAIVIVAVECAAAYFLLPSQAETTALASATLAPATAAAHSPETETVEEDTPGIEVDLEPFVVLSQQPLAGTTVRVEFHLWGVVREEDREELLEKLAENKNRFREEVIVTVRGADIADLTDAGLGLIKRRILAKSNRLFERPLLREVIFSDFSFAEQ